MIPTPYTDHVALISTTSASIPRRLSARAAVSPPMPPPTTRTLRISDMGHATQPGCRAAAAAVRGGSARDGFVRLNAQGGSSGVICHPHSLMRLARWGEVRMELQVPRRRVLEESRHVVREDQVAEQRIDPVARHPAVVNVVGVGPILGVPAGRTRQVEEQRRVDPVAAKTEDRLRPAAVLHVIGADHDLIDILHAKVGVIEARLSVEARKRQAGVDEEDVVMLLSPIAAGIDAKAALKIRSAEFQAITRKRK